jgi:hypothetical protein
MLTAYVPQAEGSAARGETFNIPPLGDVEKQKPVHGSAGDGTQSAAACSESMPLWALERVIERAIASPARRENLSRGIAGRVCEHYSTQKAAESILQLVRDAMGVRA